VVVIVMVVGGQKSRARLRWRGNLGDGGRKWSRLSLGNANKAKVLKTRKVERGGKTMLSLAQTICRRR
jgi:hypothetical protein